MAAEGAQHWGVTNPLFDPQLIGYPGVEEQRDCQRDQEQGHQDENCIRTTQLDTVPGLQAADMVKVIKKVIFHLTERKNPHSEI